MDEQKNCPKCGRSNRTTARFCGGCGYDFGKAGSAPANAAPAPSIAASAPPVQPAAKEFCPLCGKETVPGARFCRHCGGELSTPAPAPAPMPAADKTATRPEPMPAAPAPPRPAPAPVHQPAPADPGLAQVDEPPDAPRRGLPGWLWLLTGLVIGLLLGAGGALAYPRLMELQATDDATPAVEEIAPTEEAAPAPAVAEETPAQAPDAAPPPVDLPTPTPEAASDAPEVDASEPVSGAGSAPVAPAAGEEFTNTTP